MAHRGFLCEGFLWRTGQPVSVAVAADNEQTAVRIANDHDVLVESVTPYEDETPAKACACCGEPILAVAIKCKRCGSQLNPKTGEIVKHKEETSFWELEYLGVIAIFVALLVAVPLLYFAKRHPDHKSGSMEVALSYAMLIVTSLLIALEAKKVGAGLGDDRTPTGGLRSGPVAWFSYCILFWIFAFPAWMYRRSQYGLKNLSVWAILVALLVVALEFFL